ncbi:exopolysaccharide biosynthesis polyprenyl glycosylphosphotransferase [Citromicrobium bathyomarinum]|uniref:exopolysaccharide biosynthesis polyprenyl glycosylphosphotransferase n=1 Tax=Citromicrobium bathyomarinum TaxID=72174 RepID=UPI003159E990
MLGTLRTHSAQVTDRQMGAQALIEANEPASSQDPHAATEPGLSDYLQTDPVIPGLEPAQDNRADCELNVDYQAQLGLQPHLHLDKFRFQMPLILGIVALLQLGLGLALDSQIDSPWVVNSIFFTFCATTLSLLNYRNLRLFPGARRYAFILQAFLLPNLGMLGLLLYFRLPYSVPLLALGFAASVAMTWVLNVIFRHPNTEPMMIVPGDLTARLLAEMPKLYYRLCERPEDAETTNNLVVDLHADLSPEWERAIARAALRGAAVYHVKQVSESLTGRVRIDHLSENNFGMLRPNGVYFRLKDLSDKMLAAVGLVLLSPILAIAIIAIRLDSPGPAIFRQERVGFRDRPFTILKLRTMYHRDQRKDRREDAITVDSDPRVTKVGRFLRKTRIDELPQLVNVLRGELSLIGPRPEVVSLSNWYDQELDFYPYRHIVKPGITGWAQVNQGHVASTEDVYRKLQYDFYYVKNFSLWLDLLIALNTLQVVITGRGSR